MHILVFDTETTGLPKSRKDAKEEPDNWPHLVSISWVILDSENMFAITKQRNYIIKPLDWTIPEDSIKIHGITNEQAFSGSSLKDVMSEFMSEKPDFLIAHNLHFDYNVLVNALKWDLKQEYKFSIPNFRCSMLFSRKHCGKQMKLKDLYEKIFQRQPNPLKLHGSLYDTIILVECIQHSDWLKQSLGLVNTALVV
jgi:DNA polymerase III epsilon subunit-like protein